MAEEKIITLNLRKKVVKKPRYKRANYALNLIKEFVVKHYHAKPKISSKLSNFIFKNPMAKLKLRIKKIDETLEVDLQ